MNELESNRNRIRKAMELLYPLLGAGCPEAVENAYRILRGPAVEHVTKD